MKFMHISDLHIGKQVNGYSMIEDQRYILKSILREIDKEDVDGVLIAGDVYDKSVPSAEAVTVLDDFLVSLAKKKKPVFMISGNHDSAERLSFGGRLFETQNIYLSPVYQGEVRCITMEDEYGEVNVYLLPFIKPTQVKAFLKEEEERITDYSSAIAAVIDHMNIDTTKRNVLMMHQFVTGAVRCDSEEVSVGGLDQVDGSILKDFDYVALGHIHGPQKVGRENIRYCGTPLKYSLSEVNHKKSVTIVELKEKGELTIREIPLTPKRDMYHFRGTYEELSRLTFYGGQDFKDGYVHITLTDEEDILEVKGRLQTIYPNLMSVEYDNKRTRSMQNIQATEEVEKKSPLELFENLYEQQNNQELTKEQVEILLPMIESIWGEE